MIIIGGYTVIADVGNTLVKLLRDQMTPEPIPKAEMIGLCSPADKGDFRLTLFLYCLEEIGEYSYPEMRSVGPGIWQYPPLSLNLYYMMTAYSTADLHSRSLDEHRILGRAVQVFYDHGILRDSTLQGTLFEASEEIKIVRNNLSVEQITEIWNRFTDVPFKLSVSYKVGPVDLDSTRFKKTKRVMEVEVNIDG
ncbi:MAG: hypothetical protein A4E56_03383 [Pelotomaculum sp. PtaU1.Bin065]|nr:MAG: hypothetical protein A4E56_03383 [Pelotomaculum sp. PtaU1.Bin065]